MTNDLENKLKLIAVDDNPVDRRLIEEAGKKRGFNVLTFETSDEALKSCKKENPDIVIIDINLPGSTMNGYEFHDELAKLPNYNDMIIGYSSASDNALAVQEALSKGSDIFHFKDKGHLLETNLLKCELELIKKQKKHLKTKENELMIYEIYKSKIKKSIIDYGTTLAYRLKDPVSSIYTVLNYLREESNLLPKDSKLIEKLLETDYEQVVDLLNNLMNSIGYNNTGKYTDLNSEIKFNIEQCEQRYQNIKFENKTSEIPFVLGNKHSLSLVIYSVLQNAAEATEDKGIINITSSLDNKNLEFIQLSIKDNGVGIEKDLWNYMFDYHYTTKSGENSGAGLSVCYDIMKKYNGRIYVLDSTIDEGTTMNIEIPIFL